MNTIFKLLLFSILTNQLSAAPLYYRFWRGWKKEDISLSRFNKSLNNSLIPATVELYSQRGFKGYVPVLSQHSNISNSINDFPEEVALIAMESEDSYRKIRATKEGKNYGALHGDYFSKAKKSRSSVPQRYQGKVEMGSSYDLLGSNMSWDEGFVTFNIYSNPKNIEGYINKSIKYKKTVGQKSQLILVEENYVIEYILWPNKKTALNGVRILKGFSENNLKLIFETQAKNGEVYKTKLDKGEALNAQESKHTYYPAWKDSRTLVENTIKRNYGEKLNSMKCYQDYLENEFVCTVEYQFMQSTKVNESYFYYKNLNYRVNYTPIGNKWVELVH